MAELLLTVLALSPSWSGARVSPPECRPLQAGVMQRESRWASQRLPGLMPHCADEKSKDQRPRAIPQATQQPPAAGFLREPGPYSLKPGKTPSRELNQRLLGECVNEGPLAAGRGNGHDALPVYMLCVPFPSGDDSINLNEYLFMPICVRRVSGTVLTSLPCHNHTEWPPRVPLSREGN